MESGNTDLIFAICIQLLDSVLLRKSAAYVSGPLDSGLILYENLFNRGKTSEDVRETNQKRLTLFAQTLRNRLLYPVIDPGPLRVPNWNGHDYGLFFLEVMDRFAKEAWFIDGWEYSNGATKEFKYCINKRIPCVDERGSTLSLEKGKRMIERAASHIESMGADASKLRSHIS